LYGSLNKSDEDLRVTWIIAYDVTRNRIRTRISKVLAKEGMRIQKSVFLVEASTGEVEKLIELMSQQIEPATDSVCAWPLAENWQEKQYAGPQDARWKPQLFVIG
jgi:CRISPR-associated endonuclease Cas2